MQIFQPRNGTFSSPFHRRTCRVNLRCVARFPVVLLLSSLLISQLGLPSTDRTAAATEPELPLLLHETFEEGAGRWEPFDPSGWRIEREGDQAIYSQFKKTTDYRPPHRSPLLMSLLKDVVVSDLDLRLKVKSTHPDYGHRDVCIIFGYQDPAHFYYVHLGQEMDDHANQIFVVDDAPRVKISTKTTDGTPWDDEWHDVRILREVESGRIEVYFDDMETPVMTAEDKRFAWGQIGIGSFDDLSVWKDIRVQGKRAEQPAP